MSNCCACPLGLLCLCTTFAEVWQCQQCGLVVFFRDREWLHVQALGRRVRVEELRAT